MCYMYVRVFVLCACKINNEDIFWREFYSAQNAKFDTQLRTSTRATINILTNFFPLKVLGWCIPGISGVGLHFGTVQLFVGFLLGLYCFCFCSFCQLFLDLSAASCKFGFFANTILNLFAIISSFLFIDSKS